MNTNAQLPRTGAMPVALIWIAGIAITLFCVAGIAALMGWIPSSMGGAQDAAQRAAAAKPADKPATQAATQAAPRARGETPPQRVAAPAVAKPAPVVAAAPCAQCGVIESIRVVEVPAEGSGVGAVGGAVVGGILGHQVGGGRGRDLATVAGAVGGVVAGNEIEKRMKTTSSHEITVRLDDGSSRVLREGSATTWRAGQHVKVVDGALVAN